MSKNRSKRSRNLIGFESARRRRGHRIGVETLQQRQLLSTVSWISATNGSWDVAGDWSTGKVPGPSDDVVINVSGATPTVTISTTVESVNSITADDPVVISGGGLTVAADSTIGDLSMAGGILNGPGTLTVTSAFDWTGGDLDGAGTTTVASGATLSLSGSNTKYLTGGHILNNEGIATWSGTGEFDGSPGSTFNNMGTFTALSDANFGNGGQGAGVIFNNSGTFTKSGTTGTTTFSGNLLNNSGTVNIDSGTVSLNAGSATQIETGTFNVASGASFEIDNYFGGSGGPVLLNPGTTFNGSGVYELDLGTLTVNTPISVANLTMTGGFLAAGSATLLSIANLTMTGGTLVVGASATFDFSGGLFQWAGGAINGAGGSSSTWGGSTSPAPVTSSSTMTAPSTTTGQ